ncbi:MAG TPA: hypothetical protein VKI61_16450, partial [Chitinophagaceae bacterium]|nr:hypothetical protein [Chitinophagaceae bacterium]
ASYHRLTQGAKLSQRNVKQMMFFLLYESKFYLADHHRYELTGVTGPVTLFSFVGLDASCSS